MSENGGNQRLNSDSVDLIIGDSFAQTVIEAEGMPFNELCQVNLHSRFIDNHRGKLHAHIYGIVFAILDLLPVIMSR